MSDSSDMVKSVDNESRGNEQCHLLMGVIFQRHMIKLCKKLDRLKMCVSFLVRISCQLISELVADCNGMDYCGNLGTMYQL